MGGGDGMPIGQHGIYWMTCNCFVGVGGGHGNVVAGAARVSNQTTIRGWDTG